MQDDTEDYRRELVREINSRPSAREALEVEHGKDNVWGPKELTESFYVTEFMAPFVAVIRKSDGARGSLEFQHDPRLYYGFTR